MSESKTTRRDFLDLGWRLLGAAALGEFGYLGLRFLGSRESTGSTGGIVIAGQIDEFPPGTVTLFESDKFFLVRFEDGGFVALSVRCPHLACTVAWEESKERFECPCHGSQFEMDGDVINPPAPRPLDLLPVMFNGARVEVDTSQPSQRKSASVEDRIYAPTPEDTPDVTGTPTQSE